MAWIGTLDVQDGSIRRQRIFYFCPDLIRHAAERLGVPAATHGYRYLPTPGQDGK